MIFVVKLFKNNYLNRHLCAWVINGKDRVWTFGNKSSQIFGGGLVDGAGFSFFRFFLRFFLAFLLLFPYIRSPFLWCRLAVTDRFVQKVFNGCSVTHHTYARYMLSFRVSRFSFWFHLMCGLFKCSSYLCKSSWSSFGHKQTSGK